MRQYRDNPIWLDGDERDVHDEKATRLVKQYPDHFSYVKVVEKPKPEVVKVDPGPTENKMDVDDDMAKAPDLKPRRRPRRGGFGSK